jgi:two-component system response regulator MprA
MTAPHAALAEPRSPRILVVDDEPAVRRAATEALESQGYLTQQAENGQQALELIAADRPDLVLLDVTMPVLDGFAATRRLRSSGNIVPIMMLSARNTVGDRIAALDNGADAYLAKPYMPEELLARVRSLLRSSAPRLAPDPMTGPLAAVSGASPAVPAGPVPYPHTGPSSYAHAAALLASPARVLAFEDLVLDPATRQVGRAGRVLELTKTEFELLRLFLSRARQVLTRAVILKEIWGFGFQPASNTLDVYVMYLRRKLEAGGLPRLIHTERGTGYVLRTRPA